MVLGLFARFADLFGDLARIKGLEIKTEDGGYTRTFELWCKKLSDLTPEQIVTGVTNLERRIEKLTQEEKQAWPVSYAEFRGLCFIKSCSDKAIYKSWKGIPKLEKEMTQDDKKAALNKFRGEIGL